jgi:hypothetical protein
VVTDEEVLQALRVLRDWLGIEGRAAPSAYSNRQLPPDVASEDAFARIHRAELRAGTPGWTKNGRVRAVAADAWRAYVADQTTTARSRPKRTAPNARQPAPANDVGDRLDRELGIRTRRAAR